MKNYYAEAFTRIDEMGALDAKKIWDVLIEIAKAHPAVFVKAYNKQINKAFACDGMRECLQHKDGGNGYKISAIKACRSLTGKGLKEAKDAVEGKCPAWK